MAKGRTTDQLVSGLSTPLAGEMLFGALRHYYSLAQSLEPLLSRPIRDRDQDLWCLLIVGAYQLHYLRIPDHAAVHATVSACAALGKPWARGFVNGVLRSLQRGPKPSFDAAQAHPDWFADLIRAEMPRQADAVLQGNQSRAPMSLRVNTTRIDPADYGRALSEAGIESQAGLVAEQLILDQPVARHTLPGYADGLVSIQDAGAGFAPQLLAPQCGARLLDACAAPGGKLFHLLERCPDLDAVALDVAPARVAHLRDEAGRLGHRASILEADATTLEWWDGTPFHAVLLDAPCTGSGTLRRHPEMKLLRGADDLAPNAERQAKLLSSVWHTLRPGGKLLYCTCSLFSAENDAVIEEFLANTADARASAFVLPAGLSTRHGWQLTPADWRTDGFYYALLSKD